MVTLADLYLSRLRALGGTAYHEALIRSELLVYRWARLDVDWMAHQTQTSPALVRLVGAWVR